MEKSDREKKEDKEFASGLDRLKDLKRGLYRKARGGPIFGREDHGLREQDYDISEDWKEDQDMPKAQKKSSSWIKRLLIVSIVFFAVSVAVVAYIIYGGSNVVSSKNIDIEINGPVSVGGGEETSIQISIANHNSVSLELADLIVEFPNGTRSAENINQDLIRLRKTIGNISPGEGINELVRPVFFGEEGDGKEVSVTLEYRVAGSNAIFVKEEQYIVTINSAPISLSVSGLKEVSANQEIRLDIDVVSNSESVVNDLMVRVEYPFGFEFIDSSPPPTFGENSWRLGDFAPGSKRKVSVRGVVRGQDDEKKFFRVYSGIQSTENDKEIGVVYNSYVQEIALRKPFLGAVMKIGGEITSDYVAEGDEAVRVDVVWSNNLPVRVNNAKIEVLLNGEILDESSVIVERGTYDSSINTVVWDKRVIPELGVIESGESGTVKFSFKPKEMEQLIIKNPEVSLRVSVEGDRVSEDAVPEKVESFVDGLVKFASSLSFASRAVYYTGPFVNTGPIPPKAETETTYTVIWTVLNTSNNVSSGQVKASLPSYIRWLDTVFPGNEQISYNSSTGEIVWELDNIKPGVGIVSQAREVAFRISMLPSLNQVGDSPVLVSEAVLVGDDDFTGTIVTSKSRGITTRLSTDPGFNLGNEKVLP